MKLYNHSKSLCICKQRFRLKPHYDVHTTLHQQFNRLTENAALDNDGRSLCNPTQYKIGHFGDVLSNQPLSSGLKKLNLIQRKQTTQEQNGLS